MPNPPDTPCDLSGYDPKLRSLLDQRKGVLKSLSDPLRQAQLALARFRHDGDSTTDATVADLPSLTADLNRRVTELEGCERVLLAVRTARSDPTGPAEQSRLVAEHAALVHLLRGGLTGEVLARFAPAEYRALQALDDRLATDAQAVRRLKAVLAGWWQRVVVDLFREIFQVRTKAEELEGLEARVSKLRSKRQRLEVDVRRVAADALNRQAKQAAAAAHRKGVELAAADKQLALREAEAQADRSAAWERARAAAGRLRLGHRAFCDAVAQRLNATADEITGHLATLPPAAVLPWGTAAWDAWPPAGDGGKRTLQPFLSPYLRIGELHEQVKDRLARVCDGDALRHLARQVRPVTLPVVVPFIGGHRTILVSCDKRSREDGLKLVQSLVLRAAAMIGRQVKFTLLDPAGYGQSFPTQRFLQCRPTSDDVNADLKAVQQDIRRVNQNVLAGETGLHDLDARRLASEQFEVIAAAGFPEGYDRRAVETLYNVGSVGPRAGRYLILHHDRSEELPREHPIEGVTNAFRLDPHRQFARPDHLFQPDQVPPVEWQQALLDRVKEAGKIDHSLAWDDLVRPDRTSDWWAGSSETVLTTPIGVRGGSDKAHFWLGQKEGGEVCSHGVLAGMTGSGKSTLYHVLILGLAARYSPDELRLFLIDLKQGVEFLPYKDLPHAAVLSLTSPAELTLSILREMEAEMESRNQTFKQAGVGNFTDYRRLGHKLPRLLLLIDEYQRLFTDELADAASGVLLRLAQQGRSAGVHMFLGSQGFGAPGMMNQAAIFANFHLRVAMKLQPAAVAGLTEFGPTGKRLIRDITMAGKFVLNDTGKDEQTIDGQAAFLKPEDRDTLIRQLRDRAGAAAGRPVVFDGEAATDVFDNPALAAVHTQRATLTPKQLEAIARRDEGAAGGFGQPRWVAGDRPLGLWLGRRFNVHGHAMAVLVRNVQQNLLIVGSSVDARAGMLTGLLVTAATLSRPGDLEVDVLHAGGDDDDPSLLAGTAVLDRYVRRAGHPVTLTRDVAEAEPLLARYDSELTFRKETGARAAPSRLAVLVDPDRVPALRRTVEVAARPTPNQERLRRLLAEGSQYGLHLVLVFSAFSLVNLVIDRRKDLSAFAHRAGLQMSQNDSFDLFGSYKATTLQAEGGKVPVALYLNTETNDPTRFTPYAVPDPAALDGHARTLAAAVATPAGGC